MSTGRRSIARTQALALELIEQTTGRYEPDAEGAGGIAVDDLATDQHISPRAAKRRLMRLYDRDLIDYDASDDGGADVFYYLLAKGQRALDAYRRKHR